MCLGCCVLRMGRSQAHLGGGQGSRPPPHTLKRGRASEIKAPRRTWEAGPQEVVGASAPTCSVEKRPWSSSPFIVMTTRLRTGTAGSRMALSLLSQRAEPARAGRLPVGSLRNRASAEARGLPANHRHHLRHRHHRGEQKTERRDESARALLWACNCLQIELEASPRCVR